MTIAYNLGIPNAPNNPSTDQPNMLTNNNNIATYVAVDHVAFNTSGSGQHAQVTFNANNVPSVPTAPPILFTNTVAGLPQLFFYSGDTAHSTNQYIAGTTGSTFLLGGIILKWGVGALSGSPTTFSTAFPNNCFAVVITGTSTLYTGGFVATALLPGSFTSVRTSGSGATGFNYIAIGN
jgi:hypothetical protein